MESEDQMVTLLEQEEKNARSKAHFLEIEKKWESLIQCNEEEISFETLKRYNRFRLRNQLVLRKRPGLLLGFINDHRFPNFQTRELLKVADIVSLTSLKEEDEPEIDRVHYLPASDDFSKIRKKLPKGFRPKLFFDMQAAHGHMQPVGLSQMPFPTVAGICHHQHGPAAKTICEMFDIVLPVGEVFSPACNYQKANVLNLPFGFNWASFHRSFQKGKDWNAREIDLSVTFGPTKSPAYHGLRNEVIQVIENFQRKWSSKYLVKISSNLSKKDYRKLLENSKISLNVVAINGPYNYRSCEIINSGALLLQANVTDPGLKFSLDDVLRDEKEFITYNLDNLEERLLHFLEHPELARSIAQDAQKRLKTKYSYDALFKQLLDLLKDDISKKQVDKNSLVNDKFFVGKLLWQQHQNKEVQQIGAAFLLNILGEEKDTIRFFSNILAILPELIQAVGFESLKSLIAKQSNNLAESLDPQNLKQIAVQFLSIKMDHIALWYNFISLSIDLQWNPKEVIQQLVDQVLENNNWEGYSQEWILRPPSRTISNDTKDLNQLRYDYFFLPLMKSKNYKEEWDAYRKYCIKLVGV